MENSIKTDQSYEDILSHKLINHDTSTRRLVVRISPLGNTHSLTCKLQSRIKTLVPRIFTGIQKLLHKNLEPGYFTIPIIRNLRTFSFHWLKLARAL